MIIHDVAQGSVEWGRIRAGLPTASEFDRLVTPKFKVRSGEMVQTYLASKLAEWWLGGPMISACVWDMDQGKILEEEARPWLSLELNREIHQVGFVTTDDGKVGCSPDGLISTGLTLIQGGHDYSDGVEIKCPQPTAHVKALITGEVPDEYLAQVHGGMFVTGCDSWKFVSYRRGFPKLVLTVRRDATIQSALHAALDGFLFKLEAAKEHLLDLNGGPPKHSRFDTQQPTEFQSEMPS